MTSETIRPEVERQHLIGITDRELSGVTFVRDYIQLHFDGPLINAYTLPTVAVGGSIFSHPNHSFKDALCARIGATVTAAYADPGQRLLIEFSDGSSLSISLRSTDRVVQEAAVYADGQTNEWSSW